MWGQAAGWSPGSQEYEVSDHDLDPCSPLPASLASNHN